MGAFGKEEGDDVDVPTAQSKNNDRSKINQACQYSQDEQTKSTKESKSHSNRVRRMGIVDLTSLTASRTKRACRSNSLLQPTPSLDTPHCVSAFLLSMS